VPRRPRQEFEGAVHHAFPRGTNGRDLFFDDGDCQVFLVILRGVIRVYRWKVLAYCLMTNHVHLVVETPEANLGDGMRRLLGHYGRMFNRRYESGGHVFRRPYGAEPIADEAHLETAIGYVVTNPIRAGLCRAPEDWQRSSHLGAIGSIEDGCLDRPRLLEHFGGVTASYAACVAAAVDRANGLLNEIAAGR
jgi:REP-associated tyrosine transposase